MLSLPILVSSKSFKSESSDMTRTDAPMFPKTGPDAKSGGSKPVLVRNSESSGALAA